MLNKPGYKFEVEEKNGFKILILLIVFASITIFVGSASGSGYSNSKTSDLQITQSEIQIHSLYGSSSWMYKVNDHKANHIVSKKIRTAIFNYAYNFKFNNLISFFSKIFPGNKSRAGKNLYRLNDTFSYIPQIQRAILSLTLLI